MSDQKLDVAYVGITNTCEVLAKFYGPESETNAAKFINLLPNHLDGIYYLDPVISSSPCAMCGE